MPKARFAAVLVLVLVAAAATVALAYALAGIGVPVWQSAIGPVLLSALLVVKWLEYRRNR